MSVLDGFMFWKNKSNIEFSVREAPAGAQINPNNIADFYVKAVGFSGGSGAGARGNFTEPEFSLSEVKRASEVDSYIKMAIMKYSYLIFKAGYEIKGDNEKAVEYLKTRFKVMGFATQKPMDVLFQEVADDIVRYSNAFLVKSRVDKIAAGVQAKGVLSEKPIGGYFRIDPSTVSIDRDKNGAIRKYQQSTETGDTKSFPAEDVIHIYIDKDGSNAFGTPRSVAALEDVKMLRRVEGNVVSLIYRFAIPIYHFKLGVQEKGMGASDKEVENTRREVEKMALDGSLVTNERTEIKAIGIEGEALDASKYLSYFEARVFSGLGVSSSQMGRGEEKQNADSMEEQAHDTVKHIQRTCSIFFENMMINELLMEGGFSPLFKPEDEVKFVFNEISIQSKIKVENHEMLKFQSNLVTFEEARLAIGMALTTEEERLYANMIEKPLALEQINAKAAAAPSTGTGGNGTQKSAKPTKAAASLNRPSNQHGSYSVKVKENDEEFGIIEPDETPELYYEEMAINKTIKNITKKYFGICEEINSNYENKDDIIQTGMSLIAYELKKNAEFQHIEAIKQAIIDINKINPQIRTAPNVLFDEALFNTDIYKGVSSIFKDIRNKMENASQEQTRVIFNTCEYRLKVITESVLNKIYWYSYIKAGQDIGRKRAYMVYENHSSENENYDMLETSSFNIYDIEVKNFSHITFKKPGGEKENVN